MAVKERVGTVVSDKMEKTVVVAVESRFPHPIYQKTVSRTTRYKAHDEDNTCRVGDRVRITETRMGSGKGNPEFWVAVIKPGRILFEMGGDEITPEIAKEAMRLAQYKLPVKTKFIQLDEQEKPAGAKAPAASEAVTVES